MLIAPEIYGCCRHCYERGALVKVYELRQTFAGKMRARTNKGWVSIIADDGTLLLEAAAIPGHRRGHPAWNSARALAGISRLASPKTIRAAPSRTTWSPIAQRDRAHRKQANAGLEQWGAGRTISQAAKVASPTAAPIRRLRKPNGAFEAEARHANDFLERNAELQRKGREKVEARKERARAEFLAKSEVHQRKSREKAERERAGSQRTKRRNGLPTQKAAVPLIAGGEEKELQRASDLQAVGVEGALGQLHLTLAIDEAGAAQQMQVEAMDSQARLRVGQAARDTAKEPTEKGGRRQERVNRTAAKAGQATAQSRTPRKGKTKALEAAARRNREFLQRSEELQRKSREKAEARRKKVLQEKEAMMRTRPEINTRSRDLMDAKFGYDADAA